MAHEIETMAYVGEKPWHGLGAELPANPTPSQMLKAAGLEWDVVKAPLRYEIDGRSFGTEDYFGLVRESDGKLLSVCGSEYVPIQNRQIFEFFKRFTDRGHMTMETAGSLKGGKHVWALAKFSDGFTLPGGDQVRGYLLFSQPHEYGKAYTIKMTPIRVVCNNTITMALNSPHGEANMWRMQHTREFDSSMMAEVEQTMGLARDKMEGFERQARLLAETRVQDQYLVTHYIAELFQPELLKGESLLSQIVEATESPLNQAVAETERRLKIEPMQFKHNAGRVWEAIERSPGAGMDAARGTWWGAYNAVSYVVDHRLGRRSDRDAALHSAWFGDRAVLKRRAFDRAVAYAEAR